MGFIVLLFALKLVSLGGAIATTAAIVSLFALTDTLGPIFRELLIGGFAAILLGEGGSYLLARQAARGHDHGSGDRI